MNGTFLRSCVEFLNVCPKHSKIVDLPFQVNLRAGPVRPLHCGASLPAAAPPPPAVGPDPTRRGQPDLLYSRLELELRTHDTAVLNSYTKFLRQAARHLDVTIGRVYDPPRHFARMSLLKSVHIFGKHKVQYEIRTMFRVVELLRLTGSTADTFLEYSQRMLPEGIAMKVTRTAREPLPDHLRHPAELPPLPEAVASPEEEARPQTNAPPHPAAA